MINLKWLSITSILVIFSRQILQNNKDAKHRLNSFYSKFNWVFRNFRKSSLDVLAFLFNAYCTPDYGLPLWCLDGLVNRQDFKMFEVAYSNAFKRMVGWPIGTSGHAAAEAAKLLLFKHHFIYIQTKFFKRIWKSANPVIKLLFDDILKGYIFKSLNINFYSKYDCEIRENDTDVLKARIFWVQRMRKELVGLCRELQGIKTHLLYKFLLLVFIAIFKTLCILVSHLTDVLDPN